MNISVGLNAFCMEDNNTQFITWIKVSFRSLKWLFSSLFIFRIPQNSDLIRNWLYAVIQKAQCKSEKKVAFFTVAIALHQIWFLTVGYFALILSWIRRIKILQSLKMSCDVLMCPRCVWLKDEMFAALLKGAFHWHNFSKLN